MSQSTKDTPAAEPRSIGNTLNSYPVVSHRKEPLKHPTPSWWPYANAKRLELGHRVADAIASVAEELAYDIDNNLVANIRTVVNNIEKVQNWRLVLKLRGRYYKKNQQHGDWSQPYRVTIPGE